MIEKTFQSLLFILTSIVQALLYPIDILIANYIPNLDVAFEKIGTLFNYITNSFSFAVSITGLSSFSLSLIFSFLVFKFTLPFQVYIIKLAISWWKAIKT